MDADTSNEIKRQLDALTEKALSAFKRQLLGIYVAGDYREFIPEFMVVELVRAAETNASQLLADAVPQVSAISKAPAGFMLIDAAIAAHLSNLQGVVEQGRGVPLYPAMLRVAGDRFDAVRLRLIRLLENQRSLFVEPQNKGGAPFTWNWKEAEAYAMAQFPDGFPEKRGIQSRVADIMALWFEGQLNMAPGKTELNKHAKALIAQKV